MRMITIIPIPLINHKYTITTSLKVLSPEFLNSLRNFSLPNHHIKLNIGTTTILMRNIDQLEDLCNGTRLIITKLGNHII